VSESREHPSLRGAARCGNTNGGGAQHKFKAVRPRLPGNVLSRLPSAASAHVMITITRLYQTGQAELVEEFQRIAHLASAMAFTAQRVTTAFTATTRPWSLHCRQALSNHKF
jgi:hypothetical protein